MSPDRLTTHEPSLTRLNKTGLILAGLLGLLDCVGLAFPTPAGEVGPPLAITIVGAVLGVLTLVCVVIALKRGSRGAVRVAAGARILSALTAVPAFFAGAGAPLVMLAATYVVLTFVAVVLMLTPARRSVPLLD
jgi:hypothetical protein